jgi:DNA-binding transcriptional LysR family regulator
VDGHLGASAGEVDGDGATDGAYAAKSYLLARGRPERGTGLAGHDVITYDVGIRSWRGGDLGGESLRNARVIVRTNSTRMLLQAVREGLGIGALPCCLAAPDPKLERVPLGAPLELDGVWLVVHRDVQRTARVRAVIEAIEAQVEKLGKALVEG